MQTNGVSVKRSSVRYSRTQQLTYMALFTSLITVGAFIKIPVPVVPFTLQFLFTLLAGLLLGGKCGAACVALYTALGLLGLPIFAEGGGIWYLAKPSFGYIIGFGVASYVTGKLVEKQTIVTLRKVLLYNFIGLFIVYAVGMVYYYFVCNFVIQTPIGLWPLVLYCFLLAVPGDIVLCIIAALLFKRIRPLLWRMRR